LPSGPTSFQTLSSSLMVAYSPSSAGRPAAALWGYGTRNRIRLSASHLPDAYQPRWVWKLVLFRVN